MATKSSFSRDREMATAYMLSFPQLAAFALIFAAIGGFMVWRGYAAPHTKPGSGGSATLTATPNPVLVNSSVLFNGCGYLFEPARLHISGPNNYSVDYWTTVWANGNCLSASWNTNVPAGDYMASIYQASSSHKNASDVLMSSTLVTVQ